MLRRPPRSTLFPYPPLFRSLDEGSGAQLEALVRSQGYSEQPNPFDAQIAAEMKSGASPTKSEEHTSELQSQFHLVCRLLLEKKKSEHMQRVHAPISKSRPHR